MSRSMQYLDASRDNFSRNNDNGWAVEKTLFMPASAEVLWLTDGIRSGIRPTVNSRDAVFKMAICGKVS